MDPPTSPWENHPPITRGAARPSLHHCKRGQWSRQHSPPVGLGCICAGGELFPHPLYLQLKEGCLPMENPQAGGMGAAGKAAATFKGPQGIGEDQW